MENKSISRKGNDLSPSNAIILHVICKLTILTTLNFEDLITGFREGTNG